MASNGIRPHTTASDGLRSYPIVYVGFRWHATVCDGLRWHSTASSRTPSSQCPTPRMKPNTLTMPLAIMPTTEKMACVTVYNSTKKKLNIIIAHTIFDSTWGHYIGPILPTKLLKISEICNFQSLFLLPIQPFFRPLLHLFSQSFPCVARIS